MRCSYCSAKGHSKRNCEVLKRHFSVFVEASQAIRRDYLALLKEKKIGPGTSFRVSNYGDQLVRVTSISSLSLFSTWSGGRTSSSWGYLPLERVKKIHVEKSSDGSGALFAPWVRRFSIAEIFSDHSQLSLCEGRFLSQDEENSWVACAEYAKPADMIAARGKPKASVFAASNHPYVPKR